MKNSPPDQQSNKQAVEQAGVQLDELAEALDEHAIVSVTDTAGNILYANRRFCDISGYTSEELLGQNHRLVKSGRHAPAFYRDLWKLISSGGKWQGQICNHRKNGEEYWLESTITPVLDASGKPCKYICLQTDITQQKDNEERMRLGLKYSNIGTWEWDIPSGELFWSERIAGLFGYRDGEIETSYENFINAVHPADRKLVEAAVQAALDEDTPYEIEHRVLWPDNSVRWVMERGAVYRDAEGKPLKMLGIVQDIHQRKIGQIDLEQQQMQLKQAQQTARLANWHTNVKTRTFDASETAYEIYGLDSSKEKLSIDSFKNCVYPPDRPLLEEIGDQIKASGCYDVTHRILRPDGEIRHVHVTGQATKDSSGNIISLSGAIQDITNRVELERRLKETEQIFTVAVESAGDGVWQYDFSKSIVSCSPQCMGMLGFEKERVSLSSGQWLDLIHPDDRERLTEAAQNYLTGNSDTYNAQVRMRCKSGEYKWVLCRGGGIQNDSEGHPTQLIGINSDISDIKQKETELVVARNEADKANRAKSEFLSNMSHELRTPLNAIIGFGQLLELDASLSADNSQYVHEVVKAGEHLLELINGILDLAKVEAGRIMLSIETIALLPLLKEAITLIRPLADEKRISLEISGNTDATIAVDRVRLKQILINLISNAIKYNLDNGRVRVTIGANESNMAYIDVEDTGPGLDKDQLEHIFEPFNRANAEHSNIEGTGIGLTITRQLVEMMGGKISVESTPGIGSQFRVIFPLHEEPGQTDTPEHKPADRQYFHSPPNHRAILYIDDNPSNLRLVKNILQTVPNLELVDTHSPELGLDIAGRTPFDLILLDINMPGMDGYEVLRELKKRPGIEDVPIIAVSASAMPSDIKRGMDAGFSDYISKPFDVRHFRQTVLDVITTERQQSAPADNAKGRKPFWKGLIG